MTSTRLLISSLLLIATISCSTDEATTTPEPVATPAASPPVVAPAATRRTPIAMADSNVDGVRVEVTQLKRISGETVDLRFSIVNDKDIDLPFAEWWAFMDGSAIGGVTLIDLVGKRKYFVAKDSQGGCVCNGFQGLKRRSRVNLWARFPAPPEDVERISIMIPNVPPIDDVPISR